MPKGSAQIEGATVKALRRTASMVKAWGSGPGAITFGIASRPSMLLRPIRTRGGAPGRPAWASSRTRAPLSSAMSPK